MNNGLVLELWIRRIRQNLHTVADGSKHLFAGTALFRKWEILLKLPVNRLSINELPNALLMPTR